MATNKLHKFPKAIIPSWFLMSVLVVATSTLMVTVFLKSDARNLSAAAKLDRVTKQVDAARDSLRYGYPLAFDAGDVNESEITPQSRVAFVLYVIRFVLFCLLAGAGGFLTVSSILAIRTEVSERGDRDQDQYNHLLTVAENLPSSAWLLRHRPRFFSSSPNVGVSRSSVVHATDRTVLSRLVLLLCCGMFLSGGFVYSATQHFTAIRNGYEIQDLQTELKRLRNMSAASRPIKGPHFIVDLPDDPVTTPPTNLVSYVPTGLVLALILGFFAIVGSLIGVIRFLIGIKLGATRIANAPGARYLAVVDFLYSPRTVEETFKPIIADWRFEYFNALSQKRRIKARWISIRYYYRLAVVMGLSNAYALIKVIVRR